MRYTISLVTIITGLASTLHAADWSGWRGPDGLGVSRETKLPAEWNKDKNIAWSAPIPGRGASSPIIVGDRVYVTTQTEDKGLHVIAVDCKGGKVLWDHEVANGDLPANKLHNMATPTPVSDGKFVWALFGTGDLVCLDRDGKTVWHRNLVKEYGPYKTNHGMGTSPMLDSGKLFIACMQQGPSYLMAVDAATGKNIWKKDRNLAPKDEAQDSYSSPIFVRNNGKTELVMEGAEAVNAYDPASGEEIWNYGGLKVPHPYGRTIAGPTAGEGVIVTVTSGFQNRGYTFAIKAGEKGNVPEDHRLWTLSKFSPDCPTPVIYNSKVFMIRDDGIASCVDLKSGKADWQERLFSANVKISPVAGDGKIYFLNGEGNCYVVKASDKLELLSTNKLEEATLSAPSISGGRLYVRTDGHLYCIAN